MLQDLIHDYLQQERGHEISLTIPIHIDQPGINKFRMSDAGRCRLMRYWKRQGKAMTPPDVEARRNMELGNVIHAWMVEAIANTGHLQTAEMQLEDEHRIGHYDVIVLENGHKILYDLKTVSGKQWYWRVDRGKGADKAQIYQLVTYASLLDVDGCRLAYIHRENLQIHEESVNAASFANAVNGDWEALIQAWEMQREPTPTPEAWECRYCSYSSECPYHS